MFTVDVEDCLLRACSEEDEDIMQEEEVEYVARAKEYLGALFSEPNAAITAVDFNEHFYADGDDVVALCAFLASRLPNVTRLRCSTLSCADVVHILQSFPRLTALEGVISQEFSDATAFQQAVRASQLRELDMREGCMPPAVVPLLPFLKKVDVFMEYAYDEEDVLEQLKQCTACESLGLHYMAQDDMPAVWDMVRALPQLGALRLGFQGFYPVCLCRDDQHDREAAANLDRLLDILRDSAITDVELCFANQWDVFMRPLFCGVFGRFAETKVKKLSLPCVTFDDDDLASLQRDMETNTVLTALECPRSRLSVLLLALLNRNLNA